MNQSIVIATGLPLADTLAVQTIEAFCYEEHVDGPDFWFNVNVLDVFDHTQKMPIEEAVCRSVMYLAFRGHLEQHPSKFSHVRFKDCSPVPFKINNQFDWIGVDLAGSENSDAATSFPLADSALSLLEEVEHGERPEMGWDDWHARVRKCLQHHRTAQLQTHHEGITVDVDAVRRIIVEIVAPIEQPFFPVDKCVVTVGKVGAAYLGLVAMSEKEAEEQDLNFIYAGNLCISNVDMATKLGGLL